MTDEAILSALWGARGEIPVSQYAITSLKSLSRDEKKRAAELLKQYADKPDCPHTEIRITRIGEDMYKLIKTDPMREDSDTPKGKPLPSQNEGRTDDFLSTVPAELKALRQWVVWREEKRDNKPTKVPYQINGKRAKSNDPTTWTDFYAAARHLNDFDSVGFVFSESDPYCGIDLDDCIDENGNIKPWAQEIVEKLKSVSYGEVSPSGKGIKFWTKGKIPTNAGHKAFMGAEEQGVKSSEADGAIEIYDHRRYFTVTGNGIGTRRRRGEIRNGQMVVNWLYENYFSKPKQTKEDPPRAVFTSKLSTMEVIEKIQSSKQAAKFNALMTGDTTGYGSQSEADMALCGVIAFWTQDSNIIDAIFRQSPLMRWKWDERHRADGATYGQMTIEKVLNELGEVYTPHNTPARTWTSPKRRSWTKPQPRRWI